MILREYLKTNSIAVKLGLTKEDYCYYLEDRTEVRPEDVSYYDAVLGCGLQECYDRPSLFLIIKKNIDSED